MERVVLNALAKRKRLCRLIFVPSATISAIVFGEADPPFFGRCGRLAWLSAFSAGKMPAGPTAKMAVLLSPLADSTATAGSAVAPAADLGCGRGANSSRKRRSIDRFSPVGKCSGMHQSLDRAIL